MSEGSSGDDGEARTVLQLRSLEADGARAPGRATAVQLGHVLPVRTRLRDYEITGLIGEGGFGIVYLAWDHSLQRKVALKEYMPASIAARVSGASALVVKSERHLDTFKAGLKSFVNEARLLARFDHPSLVKVYRFWEENGTAYMVMPFYEGPTLKTALAELGHVPGETVLRAWLRPLLDALAVMHAARCYHRDIAPDNILITHSGPLLLDFGAARHVIGDMTHALTVVLKPGFAPIEQYGEVATMAQGAWTDLYALACVVYYAITGKTPMSSVERLMDDRLPPLSIVAAGRYSASFLAAIDAALVVRPSERAQSVAEFRALLDADPTPGAYDDAAMLSRERAASIGFGDSTMPGTLLPALATQLLPRAAEEAGAPAAANVAAASIPVVAPAAASVAVDARAGTAADPFPATEIVPPHQRTAVHSAAAPVASAGPPAIEEAPASRHGLAAAAPSAAARRNAAWRGRLGAGLVVFAALAVLFVYRQRESAGSSVADVSPAASAVSPASAAAPAAEPTPAATTTLAASAPAEPAPPTSSDTLAASASAAAALAAPAREILAGEHAPAPTATRIVVPRPRADAAVVPKPAPPRLHAAATRCSDILQKASLEPLTADEAAYLKRECR